MVERKSYDSQRDVLKECEFIIYNLTNLQWPSDNKVEKSLFNFKRTTNRILDIVDEKDIFLKRTGEDIIQKIDNINNIEYLNKEYHILLNLTIRKTRKIINSIIGMEDREEIEDNYNNYDQYEKQD